MAYLSIYNMQTAQHNYLVYPATSSHTKKSMIIINP